MKRPLRPDELRLWAKVAASARPGPGRRVPEPPPAPPAPLVPAPEKPRAAERVLRPPADLGPLSAFAQRGPPSAASALTPHATHAPKGPPIDPRRRARLARERDPIEARLDLHGLDYDRAHAALEVFIRRAHAEQMRAVLVITGKGVGGDGVLRRFTPDWLRGPALRPLIAGVSEADRRHGGAGALYVTLKRPRA